MANEIKTLNTRIIIANDTGLRWGSSTKVLYKGEPAFSFNDDGSFQGIKVGDGVNTWAQLAFVTMTPAEIDERIDSLVANSAHDHSNKDILDLITAAFTTEKDTLLNSAIQPTNLATSAVAGLVKVGSDFDVAEDGTITLYKAMAFTSQKINGAGSVILEKGASIDEVTLTWSLNKVPASVEAAGQAQEATASGSLTLSDLALSAESIKGTSTTEKTEYSKTWTIKATDARGASASKSLGVYFRNKRYHGVGNITTLDGMDAAAINAFITGLNGGEFSTSRTGTFTDNASAENYIYYAYPTLFGTSSFKVGGFEGGFELLGTVAFTNNSGYTEDYYIYKSSNAGLGSTTFVVS